MTQIDYNWLPTWMPRAQVLQGWEYCCQAHQRDHKGHNLAHTGKQVQDMLWADTIRSFYGSRVFGRAFIT